MHPALGYGLAGAFAGVLSASVDAGGAGSGLAFAGAFGVHALVGVSLGLIAGVIAPALPPHLTPPTVARAMGRALWPRPEDALHRRARAVATLWIAALALRFVLPAATVAYGAVLARVRSPLFTGVAVALVGIVVALIGLALAAPARAALARGLEWAVRRWPALGPVTLPLPHLIWALVWLAASAGRWAGHTPAEQVEWAARGTGAVLIGLLGVVVGGAVMVRLVRRLNRAVGWLILVAVTLLAFAGLAAGLGGDASRDALGRHAPLSGLVARLGADD